MKITLYTTEHCHLCEQAAALLDQLLAMGHPLQVEAVDIADDDALVERYGVRIPVVQKPGCEADLGWPFDLEALAAYLALKTS